MRTRTIKVWFSTYRLARIVAAHLGETLVSLLDRLVKEEADRLGIKEE